MQATPWPVDELAEALGPQATTKKGIKQFLRINFSTTTRATEMKPSILKIESTCATEWILLLLLKVGVCSSVTKLVVQLSLFVVAKGFIRCCCLFEFFGSSFIVLT